MHIPDGYLSPQTCVAAYAVAVPTWAVASRKVEKVVLTRNVPLLAVSAALSFLIMMFNVPIPDGTSAHAVGAVIIAIVLGPWAAVLAVSVALLFQALLFGDGGILAYGANVVNMAVVMPFAGWWTYRALAGRSALTSRRRTLAAGLGGYVGINAAALATAVEFGLQPGLFHDADGTALYAPYDLSQAIPAMALPHLTIVGVGEAILTAGVLAYLVRTDPSRLAPSHDDVLARQNTPTQNGAQDGELVGRAGRGFLRSPGRAAVGAMAVLVALVPLGLLAPGGAFGEDAPEELDLGELGLRAVPEGLDRFYGFWSHTLLADYGFADGSHAQMAYWLSAVLGIAVVGATVLAVGRVLETVHGRGTAGSEGPGSDCPAPGGSR
ncbi:MAG: cobalt/nickel transport system permease protein [Actinomycetota bacterium]|nr:cobalt/nickel transport system permease protein [Actinomycetota bacterium]